MERSGLMLTWQKVQMGEPSLTATLCLWPEREAMTVPLTSATENFQY